MKYINALLTQFHNIVFICLATLCLAWAFASLTWPFGWDQGIFAWVGDVINRGGLPYRDAWEIKGPLTYYLYALVQFIFGRNLWGIRLFDLVLIFVASEVLFRFVKQLTNTIVARWCAVLFVLWYASGNFWHTAQPDGWASLFMLIAIPPLMIAPGLPRWYTLLFTGILIGSVCLIKPLYLVFLLLAFVIILLHSWSDKKQLLGAIFLITAGFSIPIAITYAWFAYHNALPDLFEQYLYYPLTIYAGASTTSLSMRIKNLSEFLLSGEVILALFPIVGLGLLILWRSSKKYAIELGLWVLIAFIIVLIQNRFFRYHCHLLCPPIAIISAVGFNHLFFSETSGVRDKQLGQKQPAQILGILLLAIVVFQIAIHPMYEVSNWVAYISQQTSREEYYAGFGDIPDTDIQAANYIQERTKADDRIYVWGWNAAIYYLSARESSSRFGYSMPLLMGEGTEIRSAYRTELINSLTTNPPVYIVIGPQSDQILGKDYDLDDFKELADFVTAKYTQEAKFGDLILYRRQVTDQSG
jgi:hypothetical protein